MTRSFPSLGKTQQEPKPLVFIMLGPPGSGKGTQAALLHEKLQIPHISTGELLRDHIRRETPLGKQAKVFIDKGLLTPDQLVLDILFDRLAQKDCKKGYILDGFPRRLSQAELLQAHLEGHSELIVLNLELSDAKVIERLSKRVMCEGCSASYHLVYSPPKQNGVCDLCSSKLVQRSDDAEVVIAKRLQVYHEQTAPLIGFYTQLNILRSINCDQPKEKIFAELLSCIPVDQK